MHLTYLTTRNISLPCVGLLFYKLYFNPNFETIVLCFHSTKGEVAGIVIGVIFVTCLIIGCSLYWYIRRGRGQSTVISTEPITTITSKLNLNL